MSLLRYSGTVLPRALPAAVVAGAIAYCIAYHPGPTTDRGQRLQWQLLGLPLGHPGVESIFKHVTTFLTLVLGFFHAQAFARWWKFRDLCGVVMGRSVDTSVMFSYSITGSAAALAAAGGDATAMAAHCARARAKLLRLMSLAQALHLQSSRRVKDLAAHVRAGLLVEGSNEHAALTALAGPGYSECYGWVMAEFYACVRAGLVEAQCAGSLLMLVQENVTRMRGAAADVLMYVPSRPARSRV
jgi:hypothetical protein